MNGSADEFDQRQLSELARRLDIPARQLLIAAARLAQADPAQANDPVFRERVLRDAKNENPGAELAARLMLTPLSDYAIGELDGLFAEIWPQMRPRQAE
jgi:hypothetical protein